MKTLLTSILFVGLGLLTACSTVTEEAGYKEVAGFYGGSVSLKKGSNISTSSTEPQGSYMEVDLNKAGISRYFSDLQIPASNCAYLVYKNLRPKQRTDYDYFKVVIQDSTATHTYTFSSADLELAAQSGSNLNTLMFSLQAADFATVLSKLDPAALDTISRDSATANLRKLSQELAPFDNYIVQGFGIKKINLAGQSVPIVCFALSVSRTPKNAVPLLVFLNPTPHTQRFLCGLRIP